MEHQAALIHNICSDGPKAGIGAAIGMLGSPKQYMSVFEEKVKSVTFSQNRRQSPCPGSYG